MNPVMAESLAGAVERNQTITLMSKKEVSKVISRIDLSRRTVCVAQRKNVFKVFTL